MKRFVKALFRRCGISVSRVPKDGSRVADAKYTPAQEFMLQLKAVGYAPQTIVDVGANRGAWTRSTMRVFPDAYYILIEPQSHLKPHLADLLGSGRVEVLNCAVADRCGEAWFKVSEWDVTSALVGEGPDSGPGAGETRVQVPVRTIDSIVREKWGRPPDLIKIDAEGHDLKVLAGAAETFGGTEVFLIEAALCCPALENDVKTVVGFMDRAGYRLAAIIDINTYQWPPHEHSPGLQWLADLAFLREGGPALAALQAPGRDQVRVAPF